MMFRSDSCNQPVDNGYAVALASNCGAITTGGIAKCAGASNAVSAGVGVSGGLMCLIGFGCLSFFGSPREKDSLDVNSENENTHLISNYEL